jgi:hypothetical protein
MSDDTTQAAKRLAEMFERPGVNLTLHGIDVSATIHSLVARAEKAEAERDRLRAQVEAARRDERAACAAEVDCGCDNREAVLARLESQGEKRASYLCTHGDVCCAIQAAAIRARGDA